MPPPPRGPRLDKRLGQHHLVNPAVCRPLLDFLGPLGGRLVVEVGPGGGLLTRELLAAGARVWGVEVDPAWACLLGRSLRRAPAPSPGRLQLVAMDAMEWPWASLPHGTLVAGNLPYNVATALVTAILPLHERVPRAAFLLQLEVAQRLAARPGTRDYGALTVFTACHAEVRILGRVRPGSFRPPPKVESAFVGLTLRAPPLPAGEMPGLLRLVRQAFGQKRKTLRNALGATVGRDRVVSALARLGLPPQARAEELPLAAWLELWRLLAPT
jgi:16S rRNA (adenine1518-N6/adenine1519-N6)-dimethyltransferase